MKKILSAACGILLVCSCDLMNRQPQTRWENDDIYYEQAFYTDAVAPKVYAVVAARATNKMLDQTATLTAKTPRPRLYIKDMQILDANLPDGFAYAGKVTRDIIDGSQTFTLVNNYGEADYALEIIVDGATNPGAETPIIIYTLRLLDRNGTPQGQWSENIKQIRNDDRSWW